jgi:uncharacterized repeat protein (TIGR02543 family)
LIPYTISTSSSPSGGGSVSGGGTYNYGTVDTLKATPATGYRFYNWTENGTTVPVSNPYIFTVTGNRTLIANFTIMQLPKICLSTTSLSGTYKAGTTSFTITNCGGGTLSWNVASSDTSWLKVSPKSGTNTGTVTVTYTKDTTARRTGTITVTAAGASNTPQIVTMTQVVQSISVSSSSLNVVNTSGSQSITVSCSGGGSLNWNIASSDTSWLKVSPTSGTNTGTVTVTYTTNSSTMTKNGKLTVSASNAINTPQYVTVTQQGALTLSLSATTGGTATKNPNQTAYNYGTSVVLTAMPATGYTFTGWSGDTTSTPNPLTVTMNGNKNITANFAWDWTQDVPYTLYFNPLSGSTSYNVVHLPWFESCPSWSKIGTGAFPKDQIDFHPGEGWVLVAKDFGTSLTNPASTFPFFALYNTYRGILRVFFWNDLVQSMSYGKAIMSISGTSATPLFTFNKNVPQFSNLYPSNTGFPDQSTITSIMPIDLTEWAVADFNLLGYDASINGEYCNINIGISGVDTTHITLAGAASFTGTLGGGSTLNIQSSSNNGSSITSDASNVTKDVKDLNTLYTDLQGIGNSLAPSWTKDHLSNLLNTAGGPIAMIPGIGSLAGFVTTFAGLISGNGTANKPQPISLKGTISLSGTLTEVNPIKTIGFPVPGSSAAGNQNGKGLYNNPLGVFNIDSIPTIAEYAIVKRNFETYPVSYLLDIYIGFENPIQIKYNPNLGLSLLSAKAEILDTNMNNFNSKGPYTQYHSLDSLTNFVFNPSGLTNVWVCANTWAEGVDLPIGSIYPHPVTNWNLTGGPIYLPGNPYFSNALQVGLTLKFAYQNTWTNKTDTLNIVKTYPAKMVMDNSIINRTQRLSKESSKMSELSAVLDLPSVFSLNQNYPNPFNPTTTIHYQIPNASYVMLKVFDMLGREVATMVDGVKEAGYYTATFSGEKLASGVYIMRLVAHSEEGKTFVQTEKMLLMK